MRRGTAVGVVLDTGVLQAVELTAEGDHLVVRRAVSAPLAAEAFADGEPADAGAVAEAVRHLFRTHHLSRRNVCVALGGRLAIASIVELGEASGAEAEQMLQDRIARYAIFEGREVLWQAASLKADGDEKPTYLVAATAEDQVRALLPALRRAGIHVSHLEPYALATIRSLTTCASSGAPPAEAARPTVLVTLRAKCTDVLIASGARPLLVRSVEQGTSDLAQRPQAAEDLLVEAKRSVDFCRVRFAGVRPRLWVCHASSEGADVAAALQDRLKEVMDGADVGAPPSWPGLAPGSAVAEGAPCAWAAVGAAMVGLARPEATAHLNLVPDDWPEIERVQKQLVGLAASIGLAVLLIASSAVLIRLAAGSAAEDAQAATGQMAANTDAVKTVSALKAKAVDAAAKVKLWEEIRAQVAPFDWPAGVDAVMAQIPEGIRVRQLQYTGGALRIIGEAQSTDLIHQLVLRLGRLPSIREANMERLIRDPTASSRLPSFTLICRFRDRAGRPPEEKKP